MINREKRRACGGKAPEQSCSQEVDSYWKGDLAKGKKVLQPDSETKAQTKNPLKT